MASRSPIRIAGSRTRPRPRCSAGPTSRTRSRARRSTRFPGARRWPIASGSSTRSDRWACPCRATRARLARYFYTRRDGKQNQAVLYVRDGLDGADRALVDVNALAADGTRALDWWVPSEDGALVAYGVSADGSEESVLHVRDVATGRDLPDEIARTRACSLAWFPDGKGFYYTRYPTAGTVPDGEEKYHRSVFRHRLGDDPARDEKIFGAGRDLKDWPGVTLSPNGRWLVVQVDQGWSKSEVYLLDVHAPGKAPPAATTLVDGFDANFDVVEALDDRIYVRSNQDAPRGRLFAADLRRPQRAHWKEILPESEQILESATVLRGQIAALYLEDATSRVRLFSVDGKPQRELALPGLGSVASLSNERARRRAVPVVHVVLDADDDPAGARRRRQGYGAAERLAANHGAARPERVPGRAGSLRLARRHAVPHVPGSQTRRARARWQAPDAALRLRRLQRQHPAALGAPGGAVPGARRGLRGRDPARWRRVRRVLAPGRHARAQAERLRRFHRRGRVADRARRSRRRRTWRSRGDRTAAC